jgi:hypothetical protein
MLLDMCLLPYVRDPDVVQVRHSEGKRGAPFLSHQQGLAAWYYAKKCRLLTARPDVLLNHNSSEQILHFGVIRFRRGKKKSSW